MSLPRRTQWMLALLVPAALAFLYAVALRPAAKERIARLEKEMQQSAAAAGGKFDAARKPRLERALAEAQTRRNDAMKRGKDLAAMFGGSRQTDSKQKIAALFNDSGLELERSQRESIDTAGSRIDPDLRALLRRHVELGGTSPETWRFDVRGDFATMLAAFEKIGEIQRAVPLSVSAEVGGGADSLRVSIWFWI